ncbi:hypothetical protein LOTGIDRAFT_152560 [Lottia gigantea]|uniref:Mitochondrial carrier protein n=1 Tax=Lottia gigantea TaxID=225164 RepID=V4B592_LOTGI|nr:hypothetical protein LOTGIDRAFT_152560 [Lottia gigantea]ESP05693.1 hypothetical protein LOTGIDRAFT_152560 [Lottia gigantea]
MQAQSGFEKTNMINTFIKTFKAQGIKGLYRGCIPPLWGSGIYRSAQFAVFEAVYTHQDQSFGKYELPGTGGIQLRVLTAGMCASTIRAIIETPLDYAKVRGQISKKWQLSQVYTGFGVTWARTMGLMCTYFILVDSGRRHFPEQFKKPLIGPFLTSGIAATLAWWIVWPLEYMKCQVQCDYGKNVSVLERMKIIIKERGGFFGLYRGLMPGTIRSFLANGTSMIVMVTAQRKVTEWGLRDT